MKRSEIKKMTCLIILITIAFFPSVLAVDSSEFILELESPHEVGHGLLTMPESVENSSQSISKLSGIRLLESASENSTAYEVDMEGIEWQRLIGSSWGDALFDLEPTSDGGYISVGGSGYNDKDVTGTWYGMVDGWIVKFDNKGTIQWQKRYGGDNYDQGMSIRQTTDGGYIFAGYTNSTKGNYSALNHGKQDFWIVKLDASGNLQWEKVLGGADDDYGLSVRQTPDGGYIVAGYTYSTFIPDIGDSHGGDNDAYVIKLDPAGNIVWQKLFGGSGTDRGSSIIPASDGGYLLAGLTDSDNSGDVGSNHGNYYDIWLLKLDDSGIPVWKKMLGGNGCEITYDDNIIQQTLDGGYILTGTTTSSGNGDVGSNNGYSDIWVVKLDVDGNIIWQNLLGGTNFDYGTAIQQTTYGEYIIAGKSLSSNSGNVGQNNGDWDIWVVKVDDEGNYLWQDSLGGSAYEQSTAIHSTDDGGYIFSGYTKSNTSGNIGMNHGYEDAWLVKLTPRLVVDVRDSDTWGLVPDAKVVLTDIKHAESLVNVTAIGRAIFTGAGIDNQYLFVNGDSYTVKATADEYRDGAPADFIISPDKQQILLNITSIERPVIEKSFSITNAWVNEKGIRKDNDADNLGVVLGPEWTQEFNYIGSEATKAQFGVNPRSIDKTLNDATIHFHYGHGGEYPNTTKTAIILNKKNSTTALLEGDNLWASEITTKWGGKNRWVVLQSCFILDDTDWGGVLGKTHGIFGYKTPTNFDASEKFLQYAKSGNTLSTSWMKATSDAYNKKPIAINWTKDMSDNWVLDEKNKGNISATVIFRNLTQMDRDHLPGSGEIAPDFYSDNNVKQRIWNCGSGVITDG
jgi:hypothetical protein